MRLGISGIGYRKDGVGVLSGERELIADLDTLPYPAHELLDSRIYYSPFSHLPFTVTETSRGCPFSCIFCNARDMGGTTPRFRSHSLRATSASASFVREVLASYRGPADDGLYHRAVFHARTALLSCLDAQLDGRSSASVALLDAQLRAAFAG